MHAVQAGAIVYAVSATSQAGIRCIVGAEGLLQRLKDEDVSDGPAAQGPALDGARPGRAVRLEPPTAEFRPASRAMALALHDRKRAHLQRRGDRVLRNRLPTPGGSPRGSLG